VAVNNGGLDSSVQSVRFKSFHLCIVIASARCLSVEIIHWRQQQPCQRCCNLHSKHDGRSPDSTLHCAASHGTEPWLWPSRPAVGRPWSDAAALTLPRIAMSPDQRHRNDKAHDMIQRRPINLLVEPRCRRQNYVMIRGLTSTCRESIMQSADLSICDRSED